MSYDPNIPQPTDLLSDSQGDIQQNFLSLDNTFGVNHFQFSLTDGTEGKHKFVEMPIIGAFPAVPPGLSGNEATIYGQTGNGSSQLFFTNGASGNGYQLTRASDANYANFATSPSGWTFLPGGLIFQYGSVTAGNDSVQTVTFPRPFTSSGNVYSIQLTGMSDGAATIDPSTFRGGVVGGSITTTQFKLEMSFTVSVPINLATVFWIAIGF